jgi:hypothetical protein
MSGLEEFSAAEAAAYRDGWRAGLALGALAIAIVAFVNLLSLEKSILAIVLASIAIGGASGQARSRARIAMAIAVLHLTVAAVAFALLHDKLGRAFGLFLSALRSLS